MKHLLNQINEVIVCVKCSDEFMAGSTDAKSLQEYSRIDAGFTDQGIQLWCNRHQINICHINFEGKKLDIDFRCLEKKNNS